LNNQIVEYAEWKNLFAKKHLEFVVCTNLTLVDEGILKYLKKHHIYISTSLDGPKELHNQNRPLQITDNSYDIVTDKIALCRNYLGSDGVSALMTTTRFSLRRLKDVVDEYRNQGFTEIFLRALNPYGFAKCEDNSIGYSMDDFVSQYLEALDYIIDVNLQGTYFMEAFAALLLTRMLSPFSTGFVDMQSPAGIGISGVVYDYDGNVYVSDEARMLASTGDYRFLMGNVHNNSYQELFNSEFMGSLIASACLESLPQCSECAFQSFCGADPVRNYSEQGDIIGHPSRSAICKRNRSVIHYLLGLIKRKDKRTDDVLWSWIARRPMSSSKGGKSCSS
jgi:His-Xaa-Ser system radical SAM maturase HxsB